jgi:hypothetical protein
MKLLTKKQLAARWGCSERHIERVQANGKGLPEIALGDRMVRFRDTDADAYEDARRKTPPGWREQPSELEDGPPPTP